MIMSTSFRGGDQWWTDAVGTPWRERRRPVVGARPTSRCRRRWCVATAPPRV